MSTKTNVSFNSRPSTIFIATSTADHGCIGPVADLLTAKGYPVIVYYSDEVANGASELRLHVTSAGTVKIIYRNTELDPSSIVAAWYRRPNDFMLYKDPLRAYSLENEYKELQQFIWDSVPAVAWLNDPWHMRKARNKLLQLVLAKKVGFIIPDTVVSNNWKPITALPSDTLAFKMPAYARSISKKGVKLLYSKKIKNHAKALPMDTLPYPGIWQTYIPKKREWRVTVVGNQVFSSAIYTSKGAKDDWRKHQADPKAVRFKTEPFPDDLKKKCRTFVKQLDLKYGAFDFIETPGGDVVFLEMNPNGQYAWLDKQVELPITKAIADELAHIAKRAAGVRNYV